MSATMTKVTSPGAQHSVSGVPSVPHPTPSTETLDSAVVDPPPLMDFAAVAKVLGPMQEMLNESATEAMYPSPPINTPELVSPAPSVYKYSVTRGRGFSVIGDRLAQLKIDGRKSALDADVTSSNRSVEPSIAEDDECELASIEEVLSCGEQDKRASAQGSMSHAPPISPVGEGTVPIALGSPTLNPRIEEYLSFTSEDLPTKAPAPCFPSTLAGDESSSTKKVLGLTSSSCSMRSDGGVTEKTNWAEEVEDTVNRACLRLEQLALDENSADPSKTVEEYYIDRLKRLLGDRKRIVPVKIQKAADLQE
jgi:hypothetical protein